MLSALILSEHSYPAMLLMKQLVHQRFVHFGPLVLEADSFNSPAPTADRDRTVSRRSEPSSRSGFNRSEQPNPWDLVQPQDALSRHRGAEPSPSLWTLGERPACYPRSTFYPLSFGASTRNRRITKPCFRTCSTCMSRS